MSLLRSELNYLILFRLSAGFGSPVIQMRNYVKTTYE